MQWDVWRLVDARRVYEFSAVTGLKSLQSGHRTHMDTWFLIFLGHSGMMILKSATSNQAHQAHPAACNNLAASRFWQPSNLKSQLESSRWQLQKQNKNNSNHQHESWMNQYSMKSCLGSSSIHLLQHVKVALAVRQHAEAKSWQTLWKEGSTIVILAQRTKTCSIKFVQRDSKAQVPLFMSIHPLIKHLSFRMSLV